MGDSSYHSICSGGRSSLCEVPTESSPHYSSVLIHVIAIGKDATVGGKIALAMATGWSPKYSFTLVPPEDIPNLPSILAKDPKPQAMVMGGLPDEIYLSVIEKSIEGMKVIRVPNNSLHEKGYEWVVRKIRHDLDEIFPDPEFSEATTATTTDDEKHDSHHKQRGDWKPRKERKWLENE